MTDIHPLSEHYIENHLKQKARRLKRELQIKQHEALNKIAIEEGFSSWHELKTTFNNEYLDTTCFIDIRRKDFNSDEEYQEFCHKKKYSKEEQKKLRKVSMKSILGAKYRSLNISPSKNVIQFVCDQSDYSKMLDDSLSSSNESNDGVLAKLIIDPYLQGFLNDVFYDKKQNEMEYVSCRLIGFDSQNIEHTKEYISSNIKYVDDFTRIFIMYIWLNGKLILDETDYKEEDLYYQSEYGVNCPRPPKVIPKSFSCCYEEIGKK